MEQPLESCRGQLQAHRVRRPWRQTFVREANENAGRAMVDAVNNVVHVQMKSFDAAEVPPRL